MRLSKDENKALCERFPFLTPWNRWSGKLITEAHGGGYWTGDPESVPEFDWEYTELDEMPEGWRRAFGEKMCEELKAALELDHDLLRWRIVQMKEKWGRLVIYDNGHVIGSFVPEILDKYERMSERLCIRCGKPATKITTGWVCPYCDACCPDERTMPIDEYLDDSEVEQDGNEGA